MISAKRFAHMLVFCLTTALGYSQDLDSEYVAPVHAVPRGEARGMKVQLLKGGMETKEYAVIFAKGDEAFPESRSLPRNTRYKAPISPL